MVGGFSGVLPADSDNGVGGGDPAGRLVLVAGWAAFGCALVTSGRGARLRIPPTLVWVPFQKLGNWHPVTCLNRSP